MLGGILVVAVGSGAYWLTGGRYVSIDDAYVRAAKETLSHRRVRHRRRGSGA